MITKSDYIFNYQRVVAAKSMGDSFRRLKLLQSLSTVEESLDKKEDKEELADLNVIRDSLREPPHRAFDFNGANIAQDEINAMNFLDGFTAKEISWMIVDGNLEISASWSNNFLGDA